MAFFVLGWRQLFQLSDMTKKAVIFITASLKFSFYLIQLNKALYRL
jgi:hypothetical protein